MVPTTLRANGCFLDLRPAVIAARIGPGAEHTRGDPEHDADESSGDQYDEMATLTGVWGGLIRAAGQPELLSRLARANVRRRFVEPG